MAATQTPFLSPSETLMFSLVELLMLLVERGEEEQPLPKTTLAAQRQTKTA